MEPTAFQYPSQQKKNKVVPMLVVGCVLLVAVIISFMIIRQPKKPEEKKEAVVVETKTPSPTSRPMIDKKTVKIQVQNGTGTPGQAGIVVKALEDTGYATENIKTGNAEKYDNLITSITAKDGYDEIVIDIKDSLKSTFEKITVVSPNLDKDSEFDIVIVTGGKIFEEPTPTATSSAAVSPTPKP
ncbi:conserved hypothetical protein [Candidatus Roizmanbacteria bacterium]|nr:conserved hypothetical protein [Candidatus Roizmanbacteria bacterium]